MHLVIQRIGRAIGEEDVRHFERAHALRLPEDYRQFLLEHNGGVPQNNTEGVRAFFCLGDHERWSLEAWFAQCQGQLPPELCPVAIDGRGNIYCIGHTEKEAGAVYLWACQANSDDGPRLARASASFARFLNGLEPYDPDDLPEVHDDDWEAWLNDEDDVESEQKPPEPAAIKVQVKRRARHWSEGVRGPTEEM